MNEPLVGLEVILGKGAKWPSPSGSEAAIFILSTLLICLVAYTILRAYVNKQKKTEHIRHLFLHKSRNSGLTTYQHNILHSIASIASSKNPLELFRSPSIFEKSVSQFIDYALKNGETSDSMKKMIRDIIIIHEKLYHAHEYRKPLEKITELDTGVLAAVCFNSTILLGKILITEPEIVVKLISPPSGAALDRGMPVQLFFWRSGDAAYTLACEIRAFKKDIIELSHEEGPDRGEEVRHPLINTLIPCVITPVFEPDLDDPSNKPVSGTLVRMNEYELTAQMPGEVDFNKNYSISFNIKGAQIKAIVSIFNERSFADGANSIVSCRINSLDDEPRSILNQYILENLI